MEKRDRKGQFRKGVSGNPRGRPTKRQTTHRTPAGYRATLLEVGAMPVPYVDRETGESGEMSLVRANMLALGRKGAGGHAPSAKAFLEKHFEAARVNGELTQLHRYLLEENSRLELEVERLRELIPNQSGGVLTLPEEVWRERARQKEEQWKNRKVDVNPR